MGGYYDAGDNVKFGLPMAFTITMLSWGVLEFRDEIAAAGELRHALDAIKWGTDYFIKAHTHPHVLWAQVIEFFLFFSTFCGDVVSLILSKNSLKEKHEFSLQEKVWALIPQSRRRIKVGLNLGESCIDYSNTRP